ncbi:MAG: hypothetical protein ACI9B8_003129 [Sulfitobacter sp.]|jgi:hypothetical protein
MNTGRSTVKLLTLTCTFILALSSIPSLLADELPTCRWLHLDQGTRVYQCVVLPPTEVAGPVEVVTETLPDPTRPIAQQRIVPSESLANIIPDFLLESMATVEPAAKVAIKLPEAPFIEMTPTDVMVAEVMVAEVTASETKAPEPKMSKPLVAQAPLSSVSSVQRIVVVANGEVESVKAIMKASNDAHFYVLPASGRLSLGVFSSLPNAQRRQATMLVIGIDSELVTLGAEKSTDLAMQSLQQPLLRSAPQYKRLVEADVTSVVKSKPQSMERKAVQAQLQSQPKVSGAGYLVAALGDQKNIIAELKRMQVTDFVALTIDPYRDRVSLGVYSLYENAFARQSYFKQLGIDSELISRDESIVVRSTKPAKQKIKAEDVPYDYNQIALLPLKL